MKTIWNCYVLFFLFIVMIPVIGYSKSYEGVISIPAAALQSRFEDTQINNTGGGLQVQDSTAFNSYAPLILPNGSKITKVILEVNDVSDTAYITARIRRYIDGATSQLVSLGTTAAASSGYYKITAGNLDITIDNILYSYVLDVYFWNSGSTSNRFHRMVVFYELDDCPGGVVVIPM